MRSNVIPIYMAARLMGKPFGRPQPVTHFAKKCYTVLKAFSLSPLELAMQRRPTHVWLLLVAIPVLVFVLLAYSLNQPPSPSDVQRALGTSVHLDRLIPLDNQRIALTHTAATFNHAVFVRRWGALEVLQSGQISTMDTPAHHATYSYQPLFLPLHSAQLLQGRVATPTITSIQVRLDNGEPLRDTITDTTFGIAYMGDQGFCTLELLDTQQHVVEQIALTPYAPNGVDGRAYDCKP